MKKLLMLVISALLVSCPVAMACLPSEPGCRDGEVLGGGGGGGGGTGGGSSSQSQAVTIPVSATIASTCELSALLTRADGSAATEMNYGVLGLNSASAAYESVDNPSSVPAGVRAYIVRADWISSHSLNNLFVSGNAVSNGTDVIPAQSHRLSDLHVVNGPGTVSSSSGTSFVTSGPLWSGPNGSGSVAFTGTMDDVPLTLSPGTYSGQTVITLTCS